MRLWIAQKKQFLPYSYIINKKRFLQRELACSNEPWYNILRNVQLFFRAPIHMATSYTSTETINTTVLVSQ